MAHWQHLKAYIKRLQAHGCGLYAYSHGYEDDVDYYWYTADNDKPLQRLDYLEFDDYPKTCAAIVDAIDSGVLIEAHVHHASNVHHDRLVIVESE